MFKSRLPVFEIRLNGDHKDIVLIKGNEYECENIPIEGSVRLELSEDTLVKRIKLSLVGEYNVEFYERDSHGFIIDSLIERLCVLKVNWANLLALADGSFLFGNFGDDITKYARLKDMEKRNPHGLAAASSDSLVSAGAHTVNPYVLRNGLPFRNQQDQSQQHYILPKGVYEFPFNVCLPSDTPESVEGLRCGEISYRLNCTLERGRFGKSIKSSRHIRLLRTLHPLSMNLIDNIDITNMWPGKAQYNVQLAKKGMPLGSTVPLTFLIVPIVKGLQLESLDAEIVQHYSTRHLKGKSPVFEEILGKQSLEFDASKFEMDKWEISTNYMVPESMNKITQTCIIKNDIILVKHRLRLTIVIKNKEGYSSELRANLPVFLYVSPHVGQVLARHYSIDPKDNSFVHDRKKDYILFNHANGSASSTQDQEGIEFEEAPPLYQTHIYDQVVSNGGVPAMSRSGTPVPHVSESSARLDDYFLYQIRSSTNLAGLNVRLGSSSTSPPASGSGSSSFSAEMVVRAGLRSRAIPTYDEAVTGSPEEASGTTRRPGDLVPSYSMSMSARAGGSSQEN